MLAPVATEKTRLVYSIICVERPGVPHERRTIHQLSSLLTEDADKLIEIFRSSVRRSVHRDYSEAQVPPRVPDHIDREAWAAQRAANRPGWQKSVEPTPVLSTSKWTPH